MILGGIIIPEGNVVAFNASMQKYREEYHMSAELKWSKVSRGKLSEYMGFIDYFFANNDTNKVAFHSLIIDNNQIDHRRFAMFAVSLLIFPVASAVAIVGTPSDLVGYSQ